MAQGDSRQLSRQTAAEGHIVKSTPRDPDEIRRDIEESRRRITESLGELQTEVSTRVERALDWRQWVSDHPGTAVGIAFGVGLYFGLR